MKTKRKRSDRFRPSVAILLPLGAIALIHSAPSYADALVLKSGHKISGHIVEDTSQQVTLRTKAGRLETFDRGQIDKIVPVCEPKELEKLTPDKPEDYFELGRRLAKSDDAEAPALAAHLIRLAIHMDSDRYYVEGHKLLVELAPNARSKAIYLRRLLRLDPQNKKLQEAILAAEAESEEEQKHQNSNCVVGLAAYVRVDINVANSALRKWIPPDLKTYVDRSLLKPIGSILLRVKPCPCEYCLGTGRVECSTCVGTGRQLCKTCRGDGVVNYRWTRTAYPCNTCRGYGYVACTKCEGKGTMPCKHCWKDRVQMGPTSVETERVMDVLGKLLYIEQGGLEICLPPEVGLKKIPPLQATEYDKMDYSKCVYRQGDWRTVQQAGIEPTEKP